MADYAPPTGPPPPKVPPGWKAQYNDQYQEWFYINLHTKKSQWDKPTAPAEPDDAASSSAPPPYAPGESRHAPPEKGGLGSNNPFGAGSGTESDEALARRLQAEEDARSAGRPLSRGAADTYYNQAGGSPAPYGYGSSSSPAPQGYASSSQGGYGQQELPPRPEQKKGFLGKLLGKSSGGQSGSGGYPAQQQYQQGQQYYHQGPPQGQYGYAPQQGYYGQGGGYPPQQQYVQQQAPQRKHGGMGAGGGLALGAGAGLLGGLALGEAMDAGDGGGDGGGDDGGDFGGDGGGDFGGGDF